MKTIATLIILAVLTTACANTQPAQQYPPGMADVLAPLDNMGLLHNTDDVAKWTGYLQTLCNTMPLTAGTQYAMTPASLQQESHTMLRVNLTDDEADTVLSAERKHCAAV